MTFKILGTKETEKMLSEVGPKNAKKLITNTNRAVAAEVQKTIKRNVPLHRTGATKSGVKVRKRRSPPDKPVHIVYAGKGKNNVKPFWWLFIEHGTGGENAQPAHPFVAPSAMKVFQSIDVIYSVLFLKKFRELMLRESKKK
tara:strand:+ start:6391 stop:6816 length:426 start_codon:yes stop_codon:yes gene_type:complete